MKLLVVASTFPASGTDPVPAFVRDQLLALKNLKPALEIAVLAPHDRRSGTVDFRRWPAYDEYRFHYFWPWRAEQLAGRGILPSLQANPLLYLLVPFLFVGEFLALHRLTRELRPDVIYAHWFTPQGVIASWVGRITRTPFVFTTHAADVDVWRRIPLLGRCVVRCSASRARAFTAVSRRSMHKLQRFFSASQWQTLQQKGAVIPMGVTLPEMPAPEPLPQSGRTVILFMGRLVEKKGVHLLLPAFAAARARIGDSLLVIAGDGPLRDQFERQAVELGLGDAVQFTGFVAGAAKHGLLQRADVFVVPSIVTGSGDAEGLPVALLEGLAHGRICVATADSGADDILTNGTNGFMIEQLDVATLSAALIDAARLDPERRARMQTGARLVARQFDWAGIARRHHDFLFAMFDQ
jgi:glycosyltransferase involved in cell wall biosynthesis